MVKQFEVYWINLNPTKGSEINKVRPCVIISPNEMNDNLNTVIIAPLTSTIKKYPTRINIDLNNKKGQIALDQIRTTDKTRLNNKIKSIDKRTIHKVKEVLMKMFK